jgi:hypothetical protein
MQTLSLAKMSSTPRIARLPVANVEREPRRELAMPLPTPRSSGDVFRNQPLQMALVSSSGKSFVPKCRNRA